jgi:hypothetical protein
MPKPHSLDLQTKIRTLGTTRVEPAKAPRRFRAIPLSILFFGLAALLTWAVVTRSFVAYLATPNPDAALRLRASQPEALLNRAGAELEPAERDRAGGARSRADPGSVADRGERASETAPRSIELKLKRDRITKVRELIENALMSDPLSARAMRYLGQLAAAEGDSEGAAALMREGSRRSLHETLAQYWMMRYSWRQADFRAALAHADTLLRTRPQTLRYLVPELAEMATHPAGRKELGLLLQSNPPWRSQFFRHLPSAVSDARLPLNVFLSLSGSQNLPRPEEVSGYLSFLISHKFYDLAYYTWLQFLPPEQLSKTGRLFNGAFDFEPSGAPFDWTYKQGTTRISVTSPPDRQENGALLVEFGSGRSDFAGVAQLVQLPAGSYKLQGQYSPRLTTERGLLWSIACVGASKPLAKGEPLKGSRSEWQTFEFEFAIPAEECPAQSVRLTLDARSESQKFFSGSIWFDDLQIGRN